MTVSAVYASNSQANGTQQNRQNVQGSSTFGQYLTGSATTSATDGSANDAVSTFSDLMKGTPQERMFKLFLARHHLTQDQYNSLSKDDQKKLADEFKQEVKSKAKQNSQDAASLDIAV